MITRRTQYQLAKAREPHILEGLRITLEFLDEVIAIIRRSDGADAARSNLMSRFGLSQVQAQAILDMQLRRLAALERQKIEEEYQELMTKIAHYEDLLAHPEKIRALVRDDILMLREKFGDARRTAIAYDASGEFSEEDLIQQDNVLISRSAGQYIKRMTADTFRRNGVVARASKACLPAMKTRSSICSCPHARYSSLFYQPRTCLQQPCHDLPEGSRTSRGAHIANVLNLQPDETVTTLLVVRDFEKAQYITLITNQAKSSVWS